MVADLAINMHMINDLNFPRGVSIHGMLLLAANNYQVSLDALKRYDPHGEIAEITELKQIANAISVNEYSKKILTTESFITWNQYGKKRTIWKNDAKINIEGIWKNLDYEIITSQHDVHDKIIFFSIHRDVVLEQNLVDISPVMLDNFLASQIQPARDKWLRYHSKIHNLQFGWVKYNTSNPDFVLIDEIQSAWEDRPDSRQYKALTAISLVEFVRLNVKLKNFRVDTKIQRRAPSEVYSKMLRWLGFKFSDDKKFLYITF